MMAQSSGTSPLLTIGTRGSPLALAQAHEVARRIAAAAALPPAQIAIKAFRTRGDLIQDRPLAEVGGKGLFTEEIEQALHAHTIDIAVHSAKDLPTVLPHGLLLSAFLPREDARDAFISRKAGSLAELPAGALVGTASLRRQAMVKRLRADLAVVSLRGNVETRLRKLASGAVDATLLALAGLKRLGRAEEATALFDVEAFLPAVGQGAIAIEGRADDAATIALADKVNDADTASALAAERAFLAVLDGSCRTPIAGHGRIVQGRLRFRGMILRPDGSEAFETCREGPRADAAALGADAGHELRRKGGAGFFA